MNNLVVALRKQFPNLNDLNDDTLLKVTKNTLTRNIIETRLAFEDLLKTLREVIPSYDSKINHS